MVLIIIASLIAGIIIGRLSISSKIVTLSDVYTPKPDRDPKRMAQDEVMQLQNEIIKSGAVKLEKLPEGRVRVRLKVVK